LISLAMLSQEPLSCGGFVALVLRQVFAPSIFAKYLRQVFSPSICAKYFRQVFAPSMFAK